MIVFSLVDHLCKSYINFRNKCVQKLYGFWAMKGARFVVSSKAQVLTNSKGFRHHHRTLNLNSPFWNRQAHTRIYGKLGIYLRFYAKPLVIDLEYGSTKTLSWNVQGIKRERIGVEIKHIKNTHRPDILFLIKTMVNKNNNNRKLYSNVDISC